MTQDHHARPAARSEGVGAAGLLRGMVAVAGVLALANCAAEAPQIPATQEAAQYRSHARNYYAPPGPAWDPWGPYIVEASRRFDVPESWIRAVMHQESDGQEFAVSVPGAMGLMQIMPFTYDLMHDQYGLGDDPYDPHNNILAGVAYIRQMYDIYGSPGFLAAYNAGPGRLDDFLTRNRPLPAETRHYVASIGPQIAFDSPHNRSEADLMAMNHERGTDEGAPAGPPIDPSLTHSVQLAWARRTRGEEERDTELAEATPELGPVEAPAPGPSKAASVRAAWARRGSAPEIASSGGPVQARFSPAPTPAVAPAAPAEAPATDGWRLADARMTSAPSPELADSVAEAPDPETPRHVRRVRFRLIEPAVAETLPFRSGSAGGHWAIQVGAFGSAGAAHEAAGSAVRSENALLGRAHPEIATLHDRHGRLYRARLTGLTREAATRACARIGRGSCIVVSPDGA